MLTSPSMVKEVKRRCKGGGVFLSVKDTVGRNSGQKLQKKRILRLTFIGKFLSFISCFSQTSQAHFSSRIQSVDSALGETAKSFADSIQNTTVRAALCLWWTLCSGLTEKCRSEKMKLKSREGTPLVS